MEYCEEFLSKIIKSEYLQIYDNLDLEKMKKIINENIDYLIKLKGEKAIEEMINNDKLIEYFQWLVKEKTILYIQKEFLTYIYSIKERFGGKVLENLISMLIK
ncbi:Minimal nucleotidyltransferase [Candidatus Nanobsidianus stetteri]|uniref:Minimal nucleotidyltransferase n=1 Tax=Nanobsidianus stetteri TaxID=1294122 RepID=R1E5H4_NANST|nr:Minimal nucleotidyltransferase [Candidatus Nanobsidianus stetteri]